MKDSNLKRKLIPLYEKLYFVVTNVERWIILRTHYRLNIMSSLKTIKYIQNNKCSVARYGDGELSFALGVEHSIAFQNQSSELGKQLQRVLENKNESLLICMPRYLNTLKGCTAKCKRYWWEWGKINNSQKVIVDMLRHRCGLRYVYGDALITRPYMDRQDVNFADRIFRELKKIWNNRRVLIIEGEQTRLGIGNDLFDNTSSIERILAPAVNAFECYQKIKKSALDNYSGQLVLLALGPTATVLASDLADRGIQALDIGHIDIEYEWFLKRQTEKVAVEGKFTNESVAGRTYTTCKDEEYQKQIILHVKKEW